MEKVDSLDLSLILMKQSSFKVEFLSISFDFGCNIRFLFITSRNKAVDKLEVILHIKTFLKLAFLYSIFNSIFLSEYFLYGILRISWKNRAFHFESQTVCSTLKLMGKKELRFHSSSTPWGNFKHGNLSGNLRNSKFENIDPCNCSNASHLMYFIFSLFGF